MAIVDADVLHFECDHGGIVDADCWCDHGGIVRMCCIFEIQELLILKILKCFYHGGIVATDVLHFKISWCFYHGGIVDTDVLHKNLS